MALFGTHKKDLGKREIPTLVSKDCSINGDIHASTVIRIDGALTGNLVAGGLIIGEDATVNGNVKTGELIVYGTVTGDMDAEHVEIKASGKVFGEIFTKSLIIEDGGYYNGKIRMESTDTPPVNLIAESKSLEQGVYAVE